MRNLRRSLGLVSLVLAVGGSPRSARAELVVVTPESEPTAIAQAELAYAQGDGAPVTWLSLRMNRGPVAVIAALPRDATVDQGLDAWFAALEATASPNILLPRSATDCGKASSFVHVSWPRASGTPASELNLRTRSDVVTALDEQGLLAPSDLPDADRYVMWSWLGGGAAETTRTLRIVGGAAPLSLRPGGSFPVLVNSITRGPRALPAELSNEALRVKFVAGQPASDYQERLQDWLETRGEPLLETRSPGALFDWTIYSDTVSLRSLVESYALAAGRELPALDVDACTRQLQALRDADAPRPAACGDALDASLALAAAGPTQPTLQRLVVSAARGVEPDELREGGEPNPPVLRASSLDDSACTVEDAAPIVLEPPPSSGSSNPAPSGASRVVVEEAVVVDDGQSDTTEINCGSSPGPDPYDDRETTSCSSDTSSESETSDTSCSSDSSSESEDSGCSSDSSGSREDSSYDGDTCTGSAAPGAEAAQKAQASLTSRRRAPRPRRVKTSLWSVAFVALALPIRRRKRGQSARG